MFSYVTLLIYSTYVYIGCKPQYVGKCRRSALFYKAFITSRIGSSFMTFEHLHTAAESAARVV